MVAVSLFCVITITFFLFELLPGECYDYEIMHSETYVQNIRLKYGLDRPMLQRYLITLKNFCHLNFGYSYVYDGVFVNDLIKDGFKESAKIGLGAIGITVIFGIPFGILLTLIKNSRIREAIMNGLLILMSVPSFILCIILQYIFCIKLHIFPTLWMGDFFDYLLPTIMLSIVPTISVIRLLCMNILREKERDYVFTCKVRGIHKRKIQGSYILKNCMTSVVSYLGQILAGLITGSFVVETIFGISGLGWQFVNSINNRDYPLVMGLTVFYSAILMIANFAADLVIYFINPKVREEMGNAK